MPPPTTTRPNEQTRRRRARGTELGNGPPPRRGRGTNDAEVAKVVVNAMGVGDDKTMDNHGRRMSGIGAKSQAIRSLPSPPKGDRFQDANANTADGRDSDGNCRRSASSALENLTTSSSPCGEKGFPNPISEGDADVSTVQPLPSSTRRRAKEYFQRRTRERSVDAARRHARPPRRIQSATVTEQRTLSKMLVPRSQLDLSGGAKASGMPSGTRRSASLSAAIPDRFVFDPVASPFTPNATSSPKQASPSPIAVQSFSSPTPLPSHGNRKVAPLILPQSSTFETSESVPQLVPIPQSTHGLARTYTGAEQAQAHLHEQMALMRLQAYYNWLAGSTGVGMQHMDMSGGGGGLSGGVVLGRPAGQNQGRGKGQFRNTSGAYAHPKEHVVFSPGDHEASRSVLQQAGGQGGPVKPGKYEEGKKGPEGEAQRSAPKWDGQWGLREAAVSGKEIGWSWGREGANVQGH